MSSTFMEGFTQAVAAQVKRVSDAIEVACEQSLQGGEFGVIVLTDENSIPVRCGVHPSVPFGFIYYMPEVSFLECD